MALSTDYFYEELSSLANSAINNIQDYLEEEVPGSKVTDLNVDGITEVYLDTDEYDCEDVYAKKSDGTTNPLREENIYTILDVMEEL